MQQKTAIHYARVESTERAAGRLAEQERVLRQHCKINNIKTLGIYKDIASGASFDRPSFTELLHFAACNKDKIDLLLVTEWNRFSRNVGEAIAMEHRLKNLGIEVKVTSQPNDHFMKSLNNLL